jgi:hypothetical protein
MPDDATSPATELHWLTIAEMARLIERRRLSPVELSEALLARIAALDPQINAFLLPSHRRPGARPVHGLHRCGSAAVVADRRPAVRRGEGVAGRSRLRTGDRLAPAAAGARS